MRCLSILLLSISAFAADPVLRIERIVDVNLAPRPALQLSLVDLQAMPRTTVTAKTEKGVEHTFQGVALSELLKRAGLPQGAQFHKTWLTRYLLVTAHDGYRALFSLPEVDPALSTSRAVIADRMDDQPLSARDGPLRLVLPDEKMETRWVRMVERIELMSAPEAAR